MSVTKTRKPKARDKETVFPDQLSFEIFLEEVESAARGVEVKPENIPLILDFLKERFGQGLPEEVQ